MRQAIRMPKSRRRFRLTRLQMREALAAYGFLAPYRVIVTVFTLIATVTALYLSFFYVKLVFTENRPESRCVHAGDEWPLVIPRP
jgi:ABC-type sugar transport system permease subunit